MDLLFEGSRPPSVQLVGPGNYQLVCYDVESTGLDLVEDRIVQLGAYCHYRGQSWQFSQYILPDEREIHPQASMMIGMQVCSDGNTRQLIDLRTGHYLSTVSERDGLALFLKWLKFFCGESDGVIIMSHGAIFLDIPLLITAYRQHNLIEDFFRVVKGFTDTNAVFLNNPSFPKVSLHELYAQIIGRRKNVEHRGHDDAKDLHDLLVKHFNGQLSFAIPELANSTFSPECMSYYVNWKLEKEPLRADLARIPDSLLITSRKKKQTLINCLILCNFTYAKLLNEFNNKTLNDFQNYLHTTIAAANDRFNNYLTDTKDARPLNIARLVTQYFKTNHVR